MGKLFKSYLGGGTIYRCSSWSAHYSLSSASLSIPCSSSSRASSSPTPTSSSSRVPACVLLHCPQPFACEPSSLHHPGGFSCASRCAASPCVRCSCLLAGHACSRSHLALHDELVSKSFQGRLGRAFLFGNVYTRTQTRTPTRTQLLLHSPSLCRSCALCLVLFCVVRSINVVKGPNENRILMTGLHTVADLYCLTCTDNIGWYYSEAFEESEKYKEGKFIVEKAKIERVQLEEVTPSPAE